MKGFLRKNRAELLFLFPLVAYLAAFTLWPVIHAMIMAFTGAQDGVFPSTVNFMRIMGHHRFREAVFNTVFVTGAALTLEFLFGLGLALLMLERFRGRRFFRALMLLPLGVPTIVVAANMRFLFDTNGFLNEMLYRLQAVGSPVNWLGGGMLTLMAIVTADMWKVTPLVMLIMLAGLESIPKEILEAAEADGASYLKRLRFIVLPLIKPFITMALIVRGIDAFRIFELPLALTGQAVPFVATYSFFEYRQYNNPYTSAAAATVLTLIIAAAIAVYLKLARQEKGAW